MAGIEIAPGKEHGQLKYECITPVTQNVAAVVELLRFLGRSTSPLPEIVPLAAGIQLTKSSKGDVFYTTTMKSCSCPAGTYRPRSICKHRKGLLEANKASSKRQAEEYQSRMREARRLARDHPEAVDDSIKPDMAGFQACFGVGGEG